MVTLSIDKAKDELSEIIQRVINNGERIAVRGRNKKKAVLVSAKDVELLERIEDLIDLDQAKEALRDRDKAKDWEAFEKELGL